MSFLYCNPNVLVVKNNYEVNDPTSNDYGSMLPLRHIDKCAFANSFKLSEVILPQRTYEIEEYAFVNCYKLKSINLSLKKKENSDKENKCITNEIETVQNQREQISQNFEV